MGDCSIARSTGSGWPMSMRARGDAIVFAHGNPTSSYLWRNVMPHLQGLGRLVAADMIGMGGSDKLSPSGPDRYHYAQQRDYLFGLWDALDLGDNITLVLPRLGIGAGLRLGEPAPRPGTGHRVHGSRRHPDKLVGLPQRRSWGVSGHRSPDGEKMVLEQNIFVEGVLPGAIQRQLSDEEMDHYRAPFVHPGEDRRPTLSWPRNIPIDGQPADVVSVVEDYSRWLADSDVPKLFINAEPGALIRGRIRELVRTWPNLTETTVSGSHFVQEDSPDEIGAAVAEFVRTDGAT